MARKLWILLSALFIAGTAIPAHPEDSEYMRIARLSFIEGQASFLHAPDVDWSAASINMPLEPGDRIYTGRSGRAEIEFDEGSTLRLAENTDVEILALSERLIQLNILVGLATLTAAGGADFEVNTPAAAFNTVRRGVYRFDVVENGDTDAIVQKGELEAASNEFAQRISSGELLHVRIGGRPQVSPYSRRDSWDQWNDRRNADRRAYASRDYIPAAVHIGISDLDRYGRWMHIGSYGIAWVPISVGVGWSPYSIGRWCYRSFYGWTWISYEPWGWLPYHYGRWHHSASFGWCWLPGPSFSFNFWSPGLVSFYRGPGWISWCPLGPGDYYNINHYHFNRKLHGYQLGRLHALHTRAPGDNFNRGIRGAFRTAHIDHFRNRGFHDRERDGRWENIDQPWRKGALVKDRLNIQPTSASYRAMPDREAVRPAATRKARPAVIRNTPAIDSGNRERFARITNPETASMRSRIAERGGKSAVTNPKDGLDSRSIQLRGAETNREEPTRPSANVRSISIKNRSAETALSEPSRSQSGIMNRRSEAGTRIIHFRPAETNQGEAETGSVNNRATPQRRSVAAPTANGALRAPSKAQNPVRQSYQSRIPEQGKAPSSEAKRTPGTIYRSQERVLGSSSRPSIQINRRDTGSASRSINANTRTRLTPAPSRSSTERTKAVRSVRTPSDVGSGRNFARPSSRSESSSPAARRDHGSSEAVKRGSSGSGRDRR